MKDTKYLVVVDYDEIVSIDTYYVVPTSISVMLNQFKLTPTQRLVIEKVIGVALKTVRTQKGELSATLSTSVISHITNICVRSVSSSLKKLTKIGLLVKDGVSKKGTHYLIRIPSEAKKFIKKRFKPTNKTNFNKNTNSNTSNPKKQNTPNITPQPDNSPSDNNILLFKKQLKMLEKQITEESNRIVLPKDFSISQFLKKNIQFDETAISNLECLREKEKDLKLKIASLQQKKPISVKTPPSKPGREDAKSKFKFRFLNKGDIKGLLTRIKALKLSGSEQANKSLLHEVLWAVRFGWYTQFKGSTFHCFNHALKLVKNNNWRTPKGFKSEDIEGLISYHGV